MPTPRSNELISQTSEPMMKSAPRVRHASDGRTHAMPPSLSRFPSRLTGRRTPRKAQLALIADASSPSVIIMATFIGSSVVTAANGSFRSAKVAGRCSAQKRSNVWPCRSLGQNVLRASAAISLHSMPAASIAPIRLPALVPAMKLGMIPTSDKAFTTPRWASARTEPPLRANPTRRERS